MAVTTSHEKKIKQVSIILLILLIPLIICFLNLRLAVFNLDFYKQEFSQYNPEVDNPLNITQNLLNYLKNSYVAEENLISFNQEETAHLRDVKGLIQLNSLVLNILFILAIVLVALLYYIGKKEIIANIGIVLTGGGLLSLILGGIFKIIAGNFANAFDKFHRIFFEGGWLFPANYTLIKLFPEKFFIDVVYLILTRIFIAAIIILIVGILIILSQKRRK